MINYTKPRSTVQLDEDSRIDYRHPNRQKPAPKFNDRGVRVLQEGETVNLSQLARERRVA